MPPFFLVHQFRPHPWRYFKNEEDLCGISLGSHLPVLGRCSPWSHSCCWAGYSCRSGLSAQLRDTQAFSWVQVSYLKGKNYFENSDIWLSSSFCAQATVGFLGLVKPVSCMCSEYQHWAAGPCCEVGHLRRHKLTCKTNFSWDLFRQYM